MQLQCRVCQVQENAVNALGNMSENPDCQRLLVDGGAMPGWEYLMGVQFGDA